MIEPSGRRAIGPTPPGTGPASWTRAAGQPRRRTDRDERPRPGRRADARGDRDRHGHPVPRLDRRRAGRARLDAQADRLDPRPLGPHRRQRGGRRAHGRRHRRPPARPAPADPSRAAVRPVRHPAVRARRRARRGRDHPVRRAPARSPPHARPHRGLGLPARPRTRHACSAATRCSPAAGAGSTCPAARPRRWRRRSPAWAGSRTGLGVLPGHGPATTIGRERPWMELVRDEGRLFA